MVRNLKIYKTYFSKMAANMAAEILNRIYIQLSFSDIKTNKVSIHMK